MEIQLLYEHDQGHNRRKLGVCVLFTYYGACILILDVDLPEQPALIVLIHDA